MFLLALLLSLWFERRCHWNFFIILSHSNEHDLKFLSKQFQRGKEMWGLHSVTTWVGKKPQRRWQIPALEGERAWHSWPERKHDRGLEPFHHQNVSPIFIPARGSGDPCLFISWPPGGTNWPPLSWPQSLFLFYGALPWARGSLSSDWSGKKFCFHEPGRWEPLSKEISPWSPKLELQIFGGFFFFFI